MEALVRVARTVIVGFFICFAGRLLGGKHTAAVDLSIGVATSERLAGWAVFHQGPINDDRGLDST